MIALVIDENVRFGFYMEWIGVMLDAFCGIEGR